MEKKIIYDDSKLDKYILQINWDNNKIAESEVSKEEYDDLNSRYDNAKKLIIESVTLNINDVDYRNYWIDSVCQIMENIIVLQLVNGISEKEAMLEFISEYNEVRKINDLPPQLDLEPFFNLN